MGSEYTSPMGLTQQFKFCGNPFRVDLYKGCDFGCKYCFANSRNGALRNSEWAETKMKYLENKFKLAFDSDKSSNTVEIELLKHRVPLHCGGMSDPFQSREWEFKLTYGLIELCNKYNYPIVFSTKTSKLPPEYWEILNPEITAFQVSIMGYDDAFIRKYESNTPTAPERINFISELRSKGFWCSLRIQPLVDLDQALALVNACGSDVDYITVEHLKLPYDRPDIQNLFKEEYLKNKSSAPTNNLKNIEFLPSIKKHNIREVMKCANSYGVSVGVGDNDLHYLTQGRCCCGIDRINKNFDNWLKYNLTYLTTGNADSNIWIPTKNVKSNLILNTSSEIYSHKFISFKEVTDAYIRKFSRYVPTEYLEQIKAVTGLNLPKTLF